MIWTIGLVLGAAVFVPLTWMDWKSSGPDSGPPTESFLEFILRWVADPFYGDISAVRADNGRAVLVAGDVAARPVNTRAGIATTECPP